MIATQFRRSCSQARQKEVLPMMPARSVGAAVFGGPALQANAAQALAAYWAPMVHIWIDTGLSQSQV